MRTLSPEEIALYRHSAEIHAAVRGAANIAMDYAATRDLDELYVALIQLFASYDRFRVDQAEARMLGRKGRYYVISEADLDRLRGKSDVSGKL